MMETGIVKSGKNADRHIYSVGNRMSHMSTECRTNLLSFFLEGDELRCNFIKFVTS